MQSAPEQAARITQRGTVYKAIDPDTGLGLRICHIAKPRLDRLSLCTWFRSRAEAEQLIARVFGASTLEIVRFDA